MDEKNKPVEKKDGKDYSKFAAPVTDIFATGFEDIVGFIKKPWPLIWINFLIGLARGFGFFLGMTILGALVVVALHWMMDLPLIGRYIAVIITAVKQQLAQMPR